MSHPPLHCVDSCGDSLSKPQALNLDPADDVDSLRLRAASEWRVAPRPVPQPSRSMSSTMPFSSMLAASISSILRSSSFSCCSLAISHSRSVSQSSGVPGEDASSDRACISSCRSKGSVLLASGSSPIRVRWRARRPNARRWRLWAVWVCSARGAYWPCESQARSRPS